MLRDVAVGRIQRLLGYRTDKTDEIIEELQHAQTFFEAAPELPWFMVDEFHSITTTIGEERIPVPDDFHREYEEGTLWYYNSAADEDADVWTALIKDNLDYLRDSLPSTGAPQAYALTGDYFRIFPTPDAVYTLKMIYYKQEPALDTNIENGWLQYYPDLLIGYAGEQIAASLQSQFAVERFVAMKSNGHNVMLRDTEARQHENVRYVMGGSD